MLLEIYKIATTPRFGFLYMNLTAHDSKDMFFFKFEARIVPTVGAAGQEKDGNRSLELNVIREDTFSLKPRMQSIRDCKIWTDSSIVMVQ